MNRVQLVHLFAKIVNPTYCVLTRMLEDDEVLTTGLHCSVLKKAGGIIGMESESVKSANSSD